MQYDAGISWSGNGNGSENENETGWNESRSEGSVGFLSCARNSLYNEPERVVYACLGALLSFAIFATNLLIFVIFVSDKSLAHVPGHIIITGMMLASDVLIGIIPLPGYIILTLCDGWPLSKFACDVWITVDYISTNVSYLSVSAVGFERFIAIYFVLKHRVWMCRRNQIRLVCALWIFTTIRIVCLFPLWANVSGYRSQEAYGKCDHPLYYNVPVGLMHRTVSLYIPVGLVLFFYGAIILKVFRITVHDDKSAETTDSVAGNSSEADHNSRVRRSESTVTASSYSRSNLLPLPSNSPRMLDSMSTEGLGIGLGLSASAYSFSADSAHKLTVRRVMSSNFRKVSNLAKMRKSLRTVSLVLLAFLLSNLPWHVIENLRVTKQINVRATDGIYVFSWILTYMNAFPFNPLFYFFMNKHYRLAFSRCRTCTSNRTVARQRLQHQLAQSRSVTDYNLQKYSETST